MVDCEGRARVRVPKAVICWPTEALGLGETPSLSGQLFVAGSGEKAPTQTTMVIREVRRSRKATIRRCWSYGSCGGVYRWGKGG